MNWSKAIILYKFPSRERPEKFREALNSILNNSNQPELIKFIISLDSNDPTLSLYHKVIDEVLATSKVMEYRVYEGESKSKIHAVNRDLENAKGFNVIVCMSDDMRFIEKGFDDVLRSDFATYFPKGDGCLHYPDQHQGSNCMTLNVTDRIYFERFGTIYNPEYESVECDLENQDVAKMLGKYRFVERYGMYKHLHPSFGDTPYDSLYNRTEDVAVHNKDKATRARRIANNYDLIKTENGWIHPNDKPIPVFTMGEGEVQSITFTNEPPFGVTFISMAEENTEAKTIVIDLSNIAESAEKTRKLSDKLLKKVEECKSLSEEINAIGMVKVTVDVKVEALK